MSSSPYRRPPITEAVVELRFAAPIEAEQVEKIKDRLTDDYPVTPQMMQNISFIAAPGNQSSTQVWEEFTGCAKRNWAIWRKVVGWREVTRVGVRYINRIDVPNPTDSAVMIDKYLALQPVFPEFAGSQGVDTFFINGAMGIANSPFKLILNAGSTPSPMVRTTSFLLDIDISQEGNLPHSDDALWALIDEVRSLKNRVFEACITDSSRELFSS